MPIYEITYNQKKISDEPDIFFKQASDIIGYLQKRCFPQEERWRERLIVVMVSKRNKAIGHFLVSMGSRDQTAIDGKMIVKCALDSMADSIVIAHNHPSGDPCPGIKDIEETRKLKKQLDFFQINLLDHIILGEKEYFSFTEERKNRIKT